MSYINKKAVKDNLKEGDFNVSKDVYDAVDVILSEVFAKAKLRCKANKRVTIKAADL